MICASHEFKILYYMVRHCKIWLHLFTPHWSLHCMCAHTTRVHTLHVCRNYKGHVLHVCTYYTSAHTAHLQELQRSRFARVHILNKSINYMYARTSNVMYRFRFQNTSQNRKHMGILHYISHEYRCKPG